MPELTRQDRFDWNLHQGIVQRHGEEAEAFARSLTEIRKRELWRAGGFRSWTQYVEKALSVSRRTAFYLLAGSGKPVVPPTAPEDEQQGDDETHDDEKPDEGSNTKTEDDATEGCEEKHGDDVTAAVLDGRGEPVTDPKLQPAFLRVGHFNHAVNLLGRLKTALDEILAGDAGSYLKPEAQRAERLRADLRNVVTFAKPYTTCPYCQGKGCSPCHELGWTTKPAYENAPEELRY